MEWQLMTNQELHTFGIEVILPYLHKESVTVESINTDPKRSHQIVGKRWGSPAFVAVRTACFPSKGELTPREHAEIIDLADKNGAIAFFASVGIACVAYPDKSPVTSEADMCLPIRDAGFNVAYEGLVIVTTSDRVSVWQAENDG